MNDEHEGREDKGFVIKDRRRIDTDDTVKDTQPAAAPPREGAATVAEASRALPEIDFSTFVLSLSTSVMIHLGDAPTPAGTTEKDLPLAKQSIDILAMLKEKTAGNLTDEESKLLAALLYDLRLRFVSATQGPS